jgi:deoxyadenosine/deoxycytidine kinase
MKKGLFVIVEGNIASGKTELSRWIAEKYNLKLFPEPVEENPYLNRYYEDTKRWALTMQLWLLAVRFKMHREGVDTAWRSVTGHNNTNGVVFDRSIWGDTVFEMVNYKNANIDVEGHAHYRMHRDVMLEHAMVPHYTIYLDVKPEVCLERIVKVRGRSCEKDIPLKYLQQLNDEHGELINELEKAGSKVIRIDWNEFRDFEEIEEIRDVFRTPSLYTAIRKPGIY